MDSYLWQGERVRLRAVEPSDWEAHFEWNRDSDSMRRLDRLYPPQSPEAARRWAEETSQHAGKGDAFHFEVENLDGDLVGSISTHDCNPRVGTFSYGIAIRSSYQRKGYASEAIRLVLRYYFGELRYQKVTTPVYSFNEASIRLHERLGFQLEGRLRRMVFTDGQFYDALWYGLTAEEFSDQWPRSSEDGKE